jgi:hypothetical protein
MKKLMKRSKTVEQETVDVIPGMEEEARQITDDTGVVSDSESDDLPTEQKHVNKPHIEAKTKQDRNKERRRRLHEAQFRRSQWKKRQRAEWNRYICIDCPRASLTRLTNVLFLTDSVRLLRR